MPVYNPITRNPHIISYLISVFDGLRLTIYVCGRPHRGPVRGFVVVICSGFRSALLHYSVVD